LGEYASEYNGTNNHYKDKERKERDCHVTYFEYIMVVQKEVQSTRAKLKKFMKLPVPYNPGHSLEFTDIPLELLAQQMSLLEQKYFFRLKLKELANRVRISFFLTSSCH
jgi:hypothetical protein